MLLDFYLGFFVVVCGYVAYNLAHKRNLSVQLFFFADREFCNVVHIQACYDNGLDRN